MTNPRTGPVRGFVSPSLTIPSASRRTRSAAPPRRELAMPVLA